MAEDAVRFVLENLLRPIGINLSAKTIYDAGSNTEDVVNDMKQSIYIFLSYLLFENKTDARNWTRKCSINEATDILRLLGFDPFLFDLENNSQHLLITLLWLIWRADLFQNVYAEYLPKNEAYLPPYGILATDEDNASTRPINAPPKDHEVLTMRIQRLVGKLSYQLQELSDLEMSRETLHWKIRAIDPDSSLYALSLKAKPNLLAAHTEALRTAVDNAGKIKEIYSVEQTFWKWAFQIVDNLVVDRDRFDETRSLPVDWYPPLTHAPYQRHNAGVSELQDVMNEMKFKLSQCQERVGTGRLTQKNSGLNGRQIDIIKREIEDTMESLERIEEVKVEEKEESKVKLLPDLPFKEFSDTQLTRIINRSERKSVEISERCCPEIADVVSKLCDELGLVPSGWLNEKSKMKQHEEEDVYEKPTLKRQGLPKRTIAKRPNVKSGLRK